MGEKEGAFSFGNHIIPAEKSQTRPSAPAKARQQDRIPRHIYNRTTVKYTGQYTDTD